MRKYLIITECYADTLLIEILCKDLEVTINHGSGIGSVSNQMQKNQFAIGVIDNDKRKPVYFNKFKTVKFEENVKWKAYKDETRTHILFIIDPAFEKWILKNAESENIKPENFHLPKDFENFRNITKSHNIKNNLDFINFLKEIFNLKGKSLIILREWINQSISDNK